MNFCQLTLCKQFILIINMNEEKIQREITDEEAIKVVRKGKTVRDKLAKTFVPRTIFYPVEVEYKAGVKEIQIRTFVQQSSYVSAAKWEQAQEIEKKYAKLNKDYADALRAKKKPVNVKEPGNPLKLTLIEMK